MLSVSSRKIFESILFDEPSEVDCVMKPVVGIVVQRPCFLQIVLVAGLWSHYFMENRWEQWKQWQTLLFGAQNHCRW